MEKVKIFDSSSANFIENNINIWLRENPDNQIIRVLQSESKNRYNTNITVTIFYLEKKDIRKKKLEEIDEKL